MRVAVLFNAPTLPPDHPDAASEADVVDVASAVIQALVDAGHEAWPVAAGPPLVDVLDRLDVGRPPSTVFAASRVAGVSAQRTPDWASFAGPASREPRAPGLDAPRPDVVFNLIEGFGGSSGGEAYITGLLELLGLPYTGCPPEAQGLCRDKARTKALLRGSGLPTAPSLLVQVGGAIPWNGPWPAIVKPATEDASLGIDQGSVASTPEELAAAVARLRSSQKSDVLVEAYLPGREFNVGVLELDGEPWALPIAEIVYDPPPGTWPILTYAAKWEAGSAEDLASPPACPAEIDEDLAGRLADLAVGAFRATGCRDYARVDLRLDAEGHPMILEVNPNPDIGPAAGWARALRASGRDYGTTLAALVEQAWKRGRHGNG